MKSSSFSALNTSAAPGGSIILDRIQGSIKLALDILAAFKLDNSKIVRAPIATTDTIVTHNLGQAVTSWDIVDQDANAVVWKSATVNGTPTKTIILRASAPVTVAIRFA